MTSLNLRRVVVAAYSVDETRIYFDEVDQCRWRIDVYTHPRRGSTVYSVSDNGSLCGIVEVQTDGRAAKLQNFAANIPPAVLSHIPEAACAAAFAADPFWCH
jgi:hypothetical protein